MTFPTNGGLSRYHPPMHVGIVGCGTAGPAAAIFLARAGHRVTVLERAPSLLPVGAGLLIQPTGMLALARLGVLEELLSLGSRVERLHGVTTSSRTILDLAYRDLREDLFGLGLHRGALFASLFSAMHAEGVEIRCGVRALAIESIGARPLVRDTDGAVHGPFDLLVVADGARSSLRPVSLNARERVYPYGAMWFVAQDPSNQYAGVLAQVYQGTSRMIGFLPTGRAAAAAPGGAAPPPLVSLFWSIRLDAVDELRRCGIEAWKTQVRTLTDRADPILDQIHDTSQLLPAAYHDVVMPRCVDFSRGPVVFLGDAAHAMSPQLGQGANLALVDAMTLAECVDAHPDLRRSLAEFDRLRHANIRYYQFASRWLTPLFQSGYEFLTPLRDLAMGPMCRMGWTRRRMLESLVGVKTGLMPWATRPAPRLRNL